MSAVDPSAPASPADLHFTEYDLSDGGSLAPLLTDHDSAVGIYWIQFADGYSYIGQSVSVRSRLATHRRRWDDAVRARFAPCPAERLDEFELAVIQLAQKTTSLRNKLLTSRPGGDEDVVVTVAAGRSLALPWDRTRRGNSAGLGARPEATPGAYFALSNVMAFSPTDVMPLTLRAKGLMALQAVTGFVLLALVISRAVNVLS